MKEFMLYFNQKKEREIKTMQNPVTLIIISEENHGDICWTTCWNSRVADWLLYNEATWLDENVKIFNNDSYSWESIKNVLGNNWIDKVRSMTMERFNEVFDGVFHAREEELI